jgi:hypothetical protein
VSVDGLGVLDACTSSNPYQPRVPEETFLYQVLHENLETFLELCTFVGMR